MGLTKRQVSCLLLALLVPLAGCGSTTTTDRPAEPAKQRTPTVTPSPTQTRETTTTPQQAASLEALAERKGADAAGLNESTKKRVRDVLANFSENLPENKSDRRATLLTIADSVCEKKRREFSGAINLSQAETGGTEAKKLARRLSYSSQIINEQFTNDVPASEFADVRNGVDTATKYAPVLGSVERFTEAACVASEKRTDRSLRRFQVAAMMVGVDLVLVYAGVGYSPAFKGTRFAMNSLSKVGFYRLRYICGNRCWALAWSETHWILRGEMVEGIYQAFLWTTRTGMNLTAEDVAYVAEKQELNRTQVIELTRRLREDGMKIGLDMFEHLVGCIDKINVPEAPDDPKQAVESVKETGEGIAPDVLGGKGNESKQDSSPCGGGT